MSFHVNGRRALGLFLVAACGAPPQSSPPVVQPLPPGAATPPPTLEVPRPGLPRTLLSPDTTPPFPRTRHLLDSLPLRAQVAQVVMPWIIGSYEPLDAVAMQRALRWVDSLHVGGVIVGVGSPVEMAAKLNILQQAAPVPLLVASDLEGGTTIRFTIGGTPFPTQMGIAAGGQTMDAFEMGRITALEGRAVGIHMAFAPVADINSNPDNPIINTRSFGADPAMVSEYVAAAVRGMRAGGILSTAKHFPGHGDTSVDSHLALPVIRAGWPRFDSLELVPFRAAIRAGVDAVMSAHIALPGLDPEARRPGTLAPPILTGLLRDSLAFQGLVVTDALNMGAIVREYGPEEASIRAFLAGSDLVLMPTDAARAIDAMVAAVESGRIPRDRLTASVRRVLEAKERLGLFRQRDVDLDELTATVGNHEFLALGRAAMERALVLLKDDRGLLPLLRSGPQRIALVVAAEGNNALGNALRDELQRHGHQVDLLRAPANLPGAVRDSLLGRARAASAVIVATAVRAVANAGTVALPPSTTALIDRLHALRPTMLVSFGSPYLIRQLPQLPGFAIGWTNHPMAEVAMAQALAGARGFQGRLPIPVPPGWPIGSGLQTHAIGQGEPIRTGGGSPF